MENLQNNQGLLGPILDYLYEKYKPLQAGDVATYIPELGKADPDIFGICAVTVDGQVFTAGNCDHLFSIQSVSKPFAYGLALEEKGRDETFSRIGVEPSGDAFNSILLDEQTMRPYNPMVNAGAIAATSLIGGNTLEERLERLITKFNKAAGRPLSIDHAIFESERATGHRNRAIAHLMLNFGMVPEEVEEILDLYFQQCSVLVNCRDLATMAATLANVGVNPLTGDEAFQVQYVKDILSVMFTCGMYDYSGEWAYRVGVPAKSGVSGGVMAVVNRQLGIAVYSPRLDARGNSCRGIGVCADLADELGLHVFDFLNFGSSYLKTVIDDDPQRASLSPTL